MKAPGSKDDLKDVRVSVRVDGEQTIGEPRLRAAVGLPGDSKAVPGSGSISSESRESLSCGVVGLGCLGKQVVKPLELVECGLLTAPRLGEISADVCKQPVAER